jgi:phosphoesterase RecJ-like protein
MKDTNNVDTFLKMLQEVENIALIMHLNPDGDAVGATTAMGMFLKGMGKSVSMISPNAFPGFLRWIPESNLVINAEKSTDKAVDALNKADMVICLDFNARHRVGKFSQHLENYSGPVILIDHHLEPEDGFSLYFCRTSASSASEIVFDIIRDLNPELSSLTKDIAASLYVGIMTDTGSFNFSSNDPDLYPKIGALVKAGAEPELIHTLVYSTSSENRTRLLGHSLLNRLVVLKAHKTAYIYLTHQDLKRFHFRVGDTEGLVNYTLSIKGVNLGVLFTERVGHVKISLRSKGEFSVNDFARNHFTGGGHKNAAGAESKMELRDTIQMFEDLLPLYSEELNKDVEYK